MLLLMVRLLNPRSKRNLRITATALILLASAALLTLWIRNFWRADVAWIPLPSGGNVVVVSQQGQMEFVISPAAAVLQQRMPLRKDVSKWGLNSYSVIRKSVGEVVLPSLKPLRFRRLWESG
jgi:hypothetical protein